VGKNAKYHLSQPREDRFTAGTACRNTGNPGSKFFKISLSFSYRATQGVLVRHVRSDIDKKILVPVLAVFNKEPRQGYDPQPASITVSTKVVSCAT